ncbi:MAG: 16S rRNA (cytosine(1402)-N(4))-methyltransferase RsmH [Bifidobacteriaceae bacterium]|jgi:16S rRNA (cytosine1402-N4)-methyltransferase|nr:16S rRNA (cytosine(1402)-N(4))-methyltransferase RsmH [Bifidobacteriaceae bacterium]
MPRQATGHVPVAPQRVLELAGPALARPGAVFVDATIGLGGHARAVAERFPGARIIGLDRDPEAVGQARAALGGRAEVFRAPFAELDQVLQAAGALAPDAVLFDLGVSSVQLDSDERGFAYSRDVALDMRMDPGQGLSAAEILARYSREDLARVLRDYGEERFAWQIAGQIAAARAKAPVTRSGQLVELVRRAIPAPARRSGGNPAKRTFQALRVEVNSELDQIAAALPQAVRRLRIGGRIVVMSYQSLEDAVVKRALAAGAASSAPPGLPVEPACAAPYLKLLTRGAERASQDEQASNPRSKPLRLRAAEKIREPR